MATPKWVRLADEIRDQISDGRLTPGTRLPSTSQLCATYQVSTMVVRNAIIRLKARGLVEGVPGVAVFVSTSRSAPAPQAESR